MAHMQLVGFGNVAPAGAGSSALSFTVDKFIGIKDLLLSDPAGIVTSVDSVSVDGDAMYIGASIQPAAILDTNLARTRFPIPGIAKRNVTVTVTVSGAGTWGANALCAIHD